MTMVAVIFDLDGTLVDSQRDLAESMNATLRESGFPVHPVAAYRRFVGDGIVALATRALPANHRDQATVQACTRRMREIYATRWNRTTKPYAGIGEMLSELRDLKVRLGVLSNKPDPMARKVVNELLAPWPFDVVQGAEAGFARKPDPSGALDVAGRLDAAPDRVVYVGDSDTDMFTAKAAGMLAVGALWGFRDGEELAAAGATTLVRHPSQVVELFRRR